MLNSAYEFPNRTTQQKQYFRVHKLYISTKYTFWYATSVLSLSLPIIFLPSFRIFLDSISCVPQKLSMRKRTSKLNLYIQVLNSNHVFACSIINHVPLTNYKDDFLLIFIKWTISSGWANIGSRCRPNLQQRISLHARNFHKHWMAQHSGSHFTPTKLVFANL